MDVNQLLPWFSCTGQEKVVSPFLKHWEENVVVESRFCSILLKDLTPLHVKITRSTNLLSVCRRKLKLSTYLNTVSYNHISFPGNTRSQIVWVLATLGFYSITWGMITRSAGNKIHFRKHPPFRGNLVPCRCDIFRFFEFVFLGNLSTAPVISYNQTEN